MSIKNKLIVVRIVIIVALITFTSLSLLKSSASDELPIEISYDFEEMQSKINQSIPEMTVDHEITRPHSEDVINYILSLDNTNMNNNLLNEILDYIWSQTLKNNLDYNLVNAVIIVESEFNTGVTRVSSTSRDLGIMQLNNNYAYAFAEDAGVENFDPFNPYHNIEVGIFVLTRHRDYWRNQGYSEEEVFGLTLSSYNKGRTGTKRYGLASRYISKVYQEKSRLERGVDG